MLFKIITKKKYEAIEEKLRRGRELGFRMETLYERLHLINADLDFRGAQKSFSQRLSDLSTLVYFIETWEKEDQEDKKG